MTAAARRRTRILVAFAAVTSIVAAVLVAGPGYDTARVRMFAGAVWLASNRTGEVSLVDGTTGDVRAHASVAEPGTPLSVSQHDNAAFAANQKTGHLIRVDSASEQVDLSEVVVPAAHGLTVLPTPDMVYGVNVHSGTVTSIDPDTMRSAGEPRQLAEALRPDSVVVDGRGRLWAVDDKTGDLVWLSGSERRTRPAATRTGRLAVTQGLPVLVDSERGTAELLSSESGAVARTANPPLHPGDEVAVSGSVGRSRVLIANSTRGELTTCAFETGTCSRPVEIGTDGARFGTPVEMDDHAVVPDYSTGQATIVDLADGSVVAQRLLFDEPKRFELVTRDGFVFFNDPNSNVAGVLKLTGDVMTITKYTEGPSKDDNPPLKPDPREQDKQVGKPELKPGLGLPGRTLQPGRPDPVPAKPKAAIVVKPGSRGEVGDEFELTMVLTPATKASIGWEFGDGPKDYGATVRHSWQLPGVHTVEAIATLDSGRQVMAKTTITVDLAGAPPRIAELSFQRPRPVIGELVRFSADTSGNPDTWTWTVTKPGQQTPEATAGTAEFGHRFTSAGKYVLSLTVARGAKTATSSREIVVARGAVEGWGNNWHGQLNIPPAAQSGVIAIDAGFYPLALKADGSVIAWGSTNATGELDVPPEASSGVMAIAAGEMHGLALKTDGSVIGWGGRGSFGQAEVPPAAKRDVIAIAAGHHHSLALKKDGSVISWGFDSWGETKVPPEAEKDVIAIAGGGGHSLALKADGSVIAWGNAGFATDVPPEAREGVVAIAAGSMTSLALKSDGSVIWWGEDYDNETSAPPAAKSGVTAFSTYVTHGLVLKADGTLFAWGKAEYDYTPVVPPQYSSGVLEIASGKLFNLVLV